MTVEERAYRKALAAESRAVEALDGRTNKIAITHAWKLAERTNAALRAWQSARGYL